MVNLEKAQRMVDILEKPNGFVVKITKISSNLRGESRMPPPPLSLACACSPQVHNCRRDS